MAAIKYFVDLLVFFVSLKAAIFLRLSLPVGSAIYDAPTITPRAYLLLFFIWAIWTALQSITSDKVRVKGHILQIASSTLILSLAEYLIFSSENASFSRLFLAFFIFTNLLGSFVSVKLSLLLHEHAKWLSDLGEKTWKTYDSLNNILYRYNGEIIAAIIVGIAWAEYILKMGLTMSSDGITYLRIGLRFATNGEFLPGSNPPFYPLSISATSFMTQFPADGAAILSAACLITFFLIFAFLLRRFSQNAVANIILVLLLATFDDFIILFLRASTEQLFTLFLAANFFLIVKHQSKPKWIYLAGAGLIVVIAMVTRFIGITMGVMLVLYTLLLSEPQKPFVFRMRKYFLPALLVFIPLLFLSWLDNNIREAVLVYLGKIVSRRPLLSYFAGNFSIANTATGFFKVFWETAGQPYIILTLVLLLFIFLFRRNALDQKGQELLRFNLFFLFGYLALSILVLSLTAHRPTQTRYWMPLFFFVFLGIAQTIDILFRNNSLLVGKLAGIRGALLTLLIALPVYTLILQSLGVENILIDRVRDARANPIHPAQEGFNLSPTSAKFRNFFEQISKQSDQNTIVVVEGDLNEATMVFESDYEIAESFLFKSRLISSPNVTGFKFLDIQVRDQYLSYYYDGRYRELHLIIPRQYTISELIAQLEEQVQNMDPAGVYFIINEQWFNLFANEILGDELIKLQPREYIEPYRLFELQPASSFHN